MNDIVVSTLFGIVNRKFSVSRARIVSQDQTPQTMIARFVAAGLLYELGYTTRELSIVFERSYATIYRMIADFRNKEDSHCITGQSIRECRKDVNERCRKILPAQRLPNVNFPSPYILPGLKSEDRPFARQLPGEADDKMCIYRLRLDTLLENISVVTGFSHEEIKGKCRRRPQVDARRIFSWIAYGMNYTLSEIGLFLGNRDHTTIINHIKTTEALLLTNTDFSCLHKEVLKRLNGKTIKIEMMDKVAQATE